MKRTLDGTRINGSERYQNSEQQRVEAAATVPEFAARADIAHLGSQSNENSMEQFHDDSNGVANHGLTVDQRQVGAVIEDSYFSGANIRPKINNQQNYTVQQMTINQYNQPPAFHSYVDRPNTTSIGGNFGSSSWTVDDSNVPLRQRIPPHLPQPRPRSSMSRSSSDKAEGSFGGQNREENMPRGMKNDALRPQPSPRQSARGTGESTPSRSYREFLPTPQPLPQPRHDVGSTNYTRVSDSIWFYNARPLREFSRVYDAIQVLHPEKHVRIVVKLAPHTEENLKSVAALRNLEEHPNIVQVLDYDVILGLIKEIYVAMELCSQNLRQFVSNMKDKPMNFRLHATYSKQLMIGLTYIHSKGIIHGNLKPDNILFSQNMDTIKISDSGLYKNNFSGEVFKDSSYVLPGAEAYRAPEIYFNPLEVTTSCDVFSMGVVIFYLFTNGSHPFGTERHDWGYNIRHYKNRDLSLLYHPKVPVLKKPQLFYMIDGALHRSAGSRPSAKKVLENLFFEGVSSEFNVTSNSEVPTTSLQTIGLPGRGKPVQRMVKSLSDDDLYAGNKATQQKLGPLRCSTAQCCSLQDLTKLPDQPTEKYTPLPIHLLTNEVGPNSRHKHPPSFSFVKKENRRRLEFSEDLENVNEETPIQSSPSIARSQMMFGLPDWGHTAPRRDPDAMISLLCERMTNVELHMSTMMKEFRASRSNSNYSAYSSISHHAEHSYRSGSVNYSGRTGTPNPFASDDLGPYEFNFDRARCDRSRSLSRSERPGTQRPF